MYYHCIAIVESLRDPNLEPGIRDKYEKQLYKNERRLNELATHSEVNYRMYHKVVVSILFGDKCGYYGLLNTIIYIYIHIASTNINP